MAIAVGTAMTVPQMPASAACIHANPPEVHIAECVDAVDGPSFGGCSFVAATDAVAGEGQMTGEIDIEAVVYSATNPADNPMTATFICYIRVNGATQPGAFCTATGTGAVVGTCVITYTSNNATDFVQLCQDVDYAHPNYPDTSECFPVTTFETPSTNVWCEGVPWSNGDSCTFDAPLGAFAFGGTATVSSGIAFVYVEVVFDNVVVAWCSNAAPLTATCTGETTSAAGLTHDCRVWGSGGPSYQCADPPPLPLP